MKQRCFFAFLPWLHLGAFSAGVSVGCSFGAMTSKALCARALRGSVMGFSELMLSFALPTAGTLLWLWLCSAALWGCWGVLLCMIVLGLESGFAVTGAFLGGMSLWDAVWRLLLPELPLMTLYFMAGQRSSEGSLRLRISGETEELFSEQGTRISLIGTVILLILSAALRLLTAK